MTYRIETVTKFIVGNDDDVYFISSDGDLVCDDGYGGEAVRIPKDDLHVFVEWLAGQVKPPATVKTPTPKPTTRKR